MILSRISESYFRYALFRKVQRNGVSFHRLISRSISEELAGGKGVMDDGDFYKKVRYQSRVPFVNRI